MRWRQVVVLYAVAALLGAEYLRGGVQRPQQGATQRQPHARVFAVDADAVTEVRIERGGHEVVLRRESGTWIVVTPPDAAVPADLIRAFLVAVIDAEEIERVGDGGQEPATFGLDDRATRITLRLDGDRREVLLLGATNPTGTAVYARRAGSPDVLLVGRTLLYYEELILQALPQPSVPADTKLGPVGSGSPLTPEGRGE
ncbi:MAG: DUF4340 domain-containing protein [Candidatus Binatia bacterium]